jgi:hypothetical protein
VQHLRQNCQLTAGMILRALLSGNAILFEEALAERSGVSIDRIHDKSISGFRGMPEVAYPAFREALAAMRAGVLIGEQGGMHAWAWRAGRVTVAVAATLCSRGRARGSSPVLRRFSRRSLHYSG